MSAGPIGERPDVSNSDYQKGVVQALYANPRAMASGTTAAVVVAIACAGHSGDRAFLVFAGLIFAVMACRCLAYWHFRHDQSLAPVDQEAPDQSRLWAVWLGTLATILLGAMAFYAIRHDGSLFAEVATIAITLANAVGVAGRSFGSRLLVQLQMASLCLPISAAFALQWLDLGGWDAVILSLLPLVLISATADIASEQRRILDSAIRGRSRSEDLARRLSITLETTPNGILMFDHDDRLRFANAQACDLFAICAADMPREGGGGLDRAEIERRLALRLEDAARHAPSMPRPADANEREFVSRDDASNVYRIIERTNAAGETVMRIDDVTALDQIRKRVVRMARFDGLTGLANRNWFFERADAMMLRNADDDEVMIAIIDLNGLKAINDTYGHAVGDAAIRKVGERLQRRVDRAVGERGLCGRLGGDEFVVLASFTANRFGESGVESMVSTLERAIAFQLSVGEVRLDVQGSVGICVAPASELDLKTRIERADFAQYAAKKAPIGHSGRFAAEMKDQLERRKMLREDLAAAIASGELSTAYQALFSTRQNRIVGFEALARWTHPRFGNVPPDEFIALAEETGAVGAITRFQLMAATRFCQTLPDHVGVSVNASARDIAAGSIVGDIEVALAASGLMAERLVVEITETSLLDLGPSVFKTLEAVRRAGVRIALDDFGTGYSSLSYLQRLQLDAVKLDRTFLETLLDGPRTGSVLKAVRQLAEGLEMNVVVEGVETEEQLDRLTRELGFDLFQGYLFARPLPPEDAAELVGRMTGSFHDADDHKAAALTFP